MLEELSSVNSIANIREFVISTFGQFPNMFQYSFLDTMRKEHYLIPLDKELPLVDECKRPFQIHIGGCCLQMKSDVGMSLYGPLNYMFVNERDSLVFREAILFLPLLLGVVDMLNHTK